MKLWNRYRAMPVQTKASLWYTVCNFFQKGISFIVVPIYVRLISTAEYGEWTVFQSWRDVLIIFASLNLYAGVYTKTLVDNRDDRDRYTASMQGLGTVVSLGMLVLYGLTREWVNRLLELDPPFVLLLFLYFIVYPAFGFWSTRQRVEYRYRPMVAVTVVISVLTPTVSLLLLRYTDLRARALILGFLLVQCAVGLLFYIRHFWKGRCFYDRAYWRYALRFNIPLIPHYLSLIVLGQSDRLMIRYYCGKSDAGIYSFAYQIATVMNVLLAAINGSRVPWSYEQLKARIYGPLRKISNGLAVLMGAITLMAAMVAPEIILILGKPEYQPATTVIPIVALGVYFTYCYDMFCTVEFYYGATGYVMIASVVGALTNVVLNALLIPRYGFIAAAYTTLVSYISFMLMHYVFMHRVMKREGIQGEIYDIRFIVLFSLGLSAVVFAVMPTYRLPLLRYGLILALVAVMAAFRKKLMELVMTMKKK